LVGVLAAEGCSVSSAATRSVHSVVSPTTGAQVASFGWEACNLSGNGANTYVQVTANMVLQTVNVDVSASILSTKGAGFAEVLCGGSVSRKVAPTFGSSPASYVDHSVSGNFGRVATENQGNIKIVQDFDMYQDQFLSVILKTWVPSDGTASAVSRHVLAYPSLSLDAGDYLVFHMDHAGMPVDAEMQVVIAYTLT